MVGMSTYRWSKYHTVDIDFNRIKRGGLIM